VKVVCSSKVRHLKYESLRRSLEQTVLVWPHIYEHKIIGKNEDDFLNGIEEFETSFPHLNRKNRVLSKNGSYLSLTYEIQAKNVDEIISLWVASEQVQDCIAVM
jgi:putative lipoic acid-binding regulatory protein